MEQVNTSTLEEAISQIKDWSESRLNREICGFLGFNEDYDAFVVSWEDNIAHDPENYFAISPVRFLKFKTHNKIAAVWHSHIYGDAEPSLFDERMAHACQMPFLIYSCQTQETGLYKPENSKNAYAI